MLNNYEILLLFVTVAAVKGVFLGDRSHCVALAKVIFVRPKGNNEIGQHLTIFLETATLGPR